jgi:hypothetical protein
MPRSGIFDIDRPAKVERRGGFRIVPRNPRRRSIVCINRATTALGVDWAQLIAALNEYANNIFAPIWGTPAKIIDAGAGLTYRRAAGR